MTPNTRTAARAYLSNAPARGYSMAQVKQGNWKARRAVIRDKRVESVGRHAGLEGLSPHDCSHYAATFEARKGTPVDRLVDMFGWNSPTMAFQDIEAAHIANHGTARVKLP